MIDSERVGAVSGCQGGYPFQLGSLGQVLITRPSHQLLFRNMSSAEDDFTNEGSFASGTAQRSKKRRIQRACDVCRRKKSMLNYLLASTGT